jgi:DNA repair exonuclease SbcCD ATPase subunit
MARYTLRTLLKIRERDHEIAQRQFMQAINKLEEEEQRLKEIKQQMQQNRVARANMHDHFYMKAQSLPCNKREVNSLAFSSQKNISDEATLQSSLDQQLIKVKTASDNKNQAYRDAIQAKRALKTIDKHHEIWQQREKKCEELRDEYDTDNQNGVRFWLQRLPLIQK